jgi:acyl carrier protein
LLKVSENLYRDADYQVFAADSLRQTSKPAWLCSVMDAKTHHDNFAAPVPEELLKHFPARIRDCYQNYVATGDPAAADEVVLAIVKDHVPAKKAHQIPAELTDTSTLMGDLGIDSVSIADALFVLEDVFNVSISNKELVRLRTVGDLRAFVRTKLVHGKTP